MTAAPRKSLADRLKEDETAKDDNTPPVVDTNEAEVKSRDEDHVEAVKDGKVSAAAQARADKLAPTGFGLDIHTGGGSVEVAASEGETVITSPSENALTLETVVKHVYAEPMHEALAKAEDA